ncbi:MULTISPECIES: transcription antitermination factor NusB [Sinobaca]|uniref:Transcription antitermination protein NusB n=1 Tax=Sinobaca qinghaiensis TaxID=342944 RepID=A0A419V3A9_9BACL|nr:MULTISPECIES: transcription antitermination factor NusB [Sinobaca]RKD72960.1 NusB antitermination factor [Sinobaca qinghaiensis]
MNRRLARLRAVQVLYQVDLTGVEWQRALENTLEEDETADEFLTTVIEGTLEEKEGIDAQLTEHLDNWTITRVGNIDRNILRESVYEMLFVEDIPLHVSVNEAIELGKAFGGKESGSFINGVLSNVLKECELKKEEES